MPGYGGQSCGSYLGYGFIVDVDEIPRSWVNLEGFIEGKSRVNRLGGCKNKFG
jgi:hypothetical protein